jgi:hypothetical protein
MIGYRSGPDAAAGAAEAELQADVMRFVAIIALCLVAISSLVEGATKPQPVTPGRAAPAAPAPALTQRPSSVTPDTAGLLSVPPVPDPPPVAAPVSPTPPPSTAMPVADAGAATSLRLTQPTSAAPPAHPEPVSKPTPAVSPAQVERQAVAADAETAEARRAAATPRPSTERRGFTLRFESDAALLRLASRGEAGVFVFDGPRAMQLGFGPEGAQFTVATSPGSFHAIAPETVPALLRDALAKQRPGSAPVWGVTLPDQSRRALAKLLSEHDHGTLTIDSRGRVRLENDDEA